jgi:hypothetical protein
MFELSVVVDGLTISAVLHAREPISQYPTLIALHGGAYTSGYFTVAGSAVGVRPRRTGSEL